MVNQDELVEPQNSGQTTLQDKIRRAIWNLVAGIFFRYSPRTAFKFRRGLLCLFGAKLGHSVHIYPTAKIYAPWNLEMGNNACLAPDTDCYCMAKIKIGPNSTVSQYSYLCSGSHDIEDPTMPLITAPITLGSGVWVCADAFIGPGVTVGNGAVVGARASVFRDVDPWTVVGGNPAKFIKKRVLKDAKNTENAPRTELPVEAA